MCQQTNDGSKFFQSTNMKMDATERKEYRDTAVSMMEQAQKQFLAMREEPDYKAGMATSIIWNIMRNNAAFMEKTQNLFAKTLRGNL